MEPRSRFLTRRHLAFLPTAAILVVAVAGCGDKAVEAQADFKSGLKAAAAGDSNKAIADFTEAVQINPKYTEAYFARGLVHGKDGDFDKAIVDFSEVILLDPNDAKARYRRGLA